MAVKKVSKKLKRDSTPATKTDVKEIVTSIIKTLVPSMIRLGIKTLVPSMIDTKIERLAIMTKKGFDDINERMATKEELHAFHNDMNFFKGQTETSLYHIQTDVTELKSKMTNVESRLDRIEPKLDSIAIMQI